MLKALLLSMFLCVLGSALVVHMPEHNCPYFSYGIQDGKDYIGIFRANKAQLQELRWTIRFTWHDPEQELVGSISLYPDDAEAWSNLHRGFRSMIFVKFGNITDELPQLTLLKLNDNILCYKRSYLRAYGLSTAMLNYSTTATIPAIENTYKKTFPKLPVITAKTKGKWY